MTRSDTKRTGRPFLFTAAAHGAVGHAGLLIVSTLIVNIVKAIFFTKLPVDLEAVIGENRAIGRGRALWKRLDTLEASGLAQHAGMKDSNEMTRGDIARPLLSAATVHGVVGHAGLFALSILIVNIVKAIFFTKPPTEEEELLASTGDAQSKQGGMMDRCPWPFIFFHNPKQGMKDSPTWVVVCWYVLYRAWKYRSAVTVV
eukprot:CAMPEP_0197733562 /NCGR_PEP_ID=MMETSP1434-20131217/43963_1 /TAXON_ID=265543 /ORGANISM="Minutocellus polymorphus, Strain CCMP3303" /LENGTH=200 /DNA_ID=CAMNT_0043320935 /DNA_START=381 /DNA_END=984 /DNA_ORIENTATION=-